MNARMAVALQKRQKPAAVPKSLPAPTGGWNTAQNLAAMVPGTCLVLDNMAPTTTGVRIRGGNRLHATVGTDPVESMVAYRGATLKRFFAASDGSIYPVTTVVDPEVPPAADVTGQTSDYYAYTNFPTSAGYFMYAVNGTDDALLYDGTVWTPINAASTPAVTGAPTDEWSHVNVYRNRLYFVRKGSLIVDYLPVDSLGGAALQLSLAGIFSRGGSILFTATWSSESGSSALNDYLIVASTEGEFAVFQGSYPGGTDWSLVGSYELGKPLGNRAWFKAGGDIIVATERGEIPISAARMKDPAALSMDAISRDIEPDWNREAQARRSVPWETVKVEDKGYLYVNVPVVSTTTPPITFVANLQTGKWARYTGWDNRCFIVNDGQLYFGCNDGTIRQAEVSGYDLDQPYVGKMALAWDHAGLPGFTKTIKQAKAEFLTSRPFDFLLSASIDYTQSFPVPPAVMIDPSVPSTWDSGQFDIAQWDEGTVQTRKTTRWVSIGRTGEIFSVELQIPIGNVATPDAELTVLHYTTEQGGLTV